MARGAGLLGEDSSPIPTIFAEMTALAQRSEAINLGQGFPDEDGPAEVLDAAVRAIRAGSNQYAPSRGIPRLREAIAQHQREHYGLTIDPDREVLVTAGATEAIAAAILALVEPGDEVVAIEPCYDEYAALAGYAGARLVTIPLRQDPDSRALRIEESSVREAIGPRTRVIILNSPHNPSGIVLDRATLALIARLAAKFGARILSDEVYEHLAYDGEHVPIASLPDARELTITVSSAGKAFSVTGWKIGWLTAPAELVDAIAAVKQYLTFVNGTPFQHAIATGLELPRRVLDSRRHAMRARRDLLCDALSEAGLAVSCPAAGYFACADAAALGVSDAAGLCRELPRRIGVAAVPLSALCVPGSEAAATFRSWIRFAFCKREEVLLEARTRLRRLGEAGLAGQ